MADEAKFTQADIDKAVKAAQADAKKAAEKAAADHQAELEEAVKAAQADAAVLTQGQTLLQALAQPGEGFIMQRVTNNTDGPISINCQNGQQMLAPGASGEAMIHENEGKHNALDGVVFEAI